MNIKRMVAIICALLITCLTSISAFATDNRISIIEINPEDIVQPEEVIGCLADQDGFLMNDSAEMITTPKWAGTLFSMTAVSVSNLLTTYGVPGKSFTGGAMDGLTGEGLKITGKVTSTAGTGTSYSIKVGACYYNASSDTFISVANKMFPSGTSTYGWWSKLNRFFNSQTYYGHITNTAGGIVSGTLTYSVSTQP